jgi:molybdate transport system substrate-binding protein
MAMLSIMGAALGLLLPAKAQGAEIRLLASNAFKPAFQDIAPQFEQASGHKLVATYGSTGNLRATVGKGTPFDVILIGTSALDELIKQGKVAGSPHRMARSGIGVSYRNGAPKPDVGTNAALKSALLAARSISFNPQGLSGSHMLTVIDRLGITSELKPKLKMPAVSASEDVAEGLAELGVTQVSEILGFTKIGAALAGPLPPELQLYTDYSVMLGANAQQREGAQALIDFLSAPALVPLLKATGLEPG